MPSFRPALMWPDSSSACVLAYLLPTLQVVTLYFPRVVQAALDSKGLRTMNLADIEAGSARPLKPSILAVQVAAMLT